MKLPEYVHEVFCLYESSGIAWGSAYSKEMGTMIKLFDRHRQLEVELDEADWQMILLALGKTAQRRKGWDYACGEIAEKLGGRPEYEAFKEIELEIDQPKFEIKQAPNEEGLEREI